MQPLIECIPNISEGKNKDVLKHIAQAIVRVPDVVLLHTDAGFSINRTVFTFAGSPSAVAEAAFQCIARAAEQIDMQKHRGLHPRMGAVDVCPFVPLRAVSMEACVNLAKEVGRRVGNELHLPVYLYAEAATTADRRRLPDIRAGEVEGLAQKMKDKEWQPDFGPATPHPRFGAVAIGARYLLVAFNVNLKTHDEKIAKRIAAHLRESGTGKKRGSFTGCQASGWFLPEYGRSQVTMNVLDIDAAPLHALFRACCEQARELGTEVTGSEIVGLVPVRALINTGKAFLGEDFLEGVGDDELIEQAIGMLGLHDVKPFNVSGQILEHALERAFPS